jgi:hypothetical protein
VQSNAKEDASYDDDGPEQDQEQDREEASAYASSLGLNIAPPHTGSRLASGSSNDHSTKNGEDDTGTGESMSGSGSKIKSRKPSVIDVSMSNARKRVAEGLKSPLLGGMKLDEIGEKFSKGVEVK